jgi:hypothetical protein
MRGPVRGLSHRVQTVQSGPSAARLCGIRAASAHGARSRTSHNPPVVGSSPTRPTRPIAKSTIRGIHNILSGAFEAAMVGVGRPEPRLVG